MFVCLKKEKKLMYIQSIENQEIILNKENTTNKWVNNEYRYLQNLFNQTMTASLLVISFVKMSS